MIRQLPALLVALLCSTCLRAAEFAAPLAKLELADGDTIVFLGDSITQQCLYTQYVEDYFYTRMPGVRLQFHNSGVGGDRAADALGRFDRDVAAYKPKYVTVLLGMNDGGVKPYDEPTFQAYRRDMLALVERIRAIGAVPILMTPTMYDSRAARSKKPPVDPVKLEYYNAVLAFYGAWCREVAVDNGYGFVDMYSMLNNTTLAARKKYPAFTMIPDAVHPAAAGQAVMAWAMLYDLGVSRSVSTIQVQRSADGQATIRATGGKASEARFADGGVEFTFLATGIPLVLPDEAKSGAALVALGHRLSREALEVHGLEPGKYRLTIGDEPVGDYPSQELEKSFELENNDQTPQHRQATRIAELNAQRNAESVQPLRMLWRTKKQLAIVSSQLAAKPDDAKLQQDAADLTAKLSDFDGQIAKLEAAAKTIEDEIYRTAQPKPLHYRLTRID
jgi:lysophospholipase L1-like esterase